MNLIAESLKMVYNSRCKLDERYLKGSTMNKVRKMVCALAAVLALVVTSSASPVIDLWKTNAALWQAQKSVVAPKFSKDGVKAVMIEGDTYQGRPTRFFAYYALPTNATAAAKVPGIVLVHGGGGTAFDSWVRTWVARGYAAIAMDTCGGVPPRDGVIGRLSHKDSGPDGWGNFERVNEPLTDQWTYHAVATIIRSHSFLRSLPEVDSSRIGITGISWGGYLTSCVMGIDDRFIFAAPVYGCGYLLDHSFWTKSMRELGSAGVRWDELWDPKNFLPKAKKIPVLWCTGSNDFAYPLDSLQRCYDLLPQMPTLCVKVRMVHSHPPEGDPPEITAFANSIVFGGAPLPEITAATMSGDTLSVVWNSPRRKVVKAALIHTDSADPNWKERYYDSEPIAFSGASLTVRVPSAAVLWYVNLETDDGFIVSTRHFQAQKD